jgi:hypothetical protein
MNHKVSDTNGLAARARSGGGGASAAHSAHNVAQAAQAAAHSAQAAAQVAALNVTSAAQGVGKTVKEGVHTARGWAAPRLENAADYCTTTAAPRVSSALRTTARQVSPEDTKSAKSRLRPALSWPFLVVAALAAAGAAVAVAAARQRYRAAMEAVTESDSADAADPEDPPITAPGQDAGDLNEATTAKGSDPAQDASTDASTDASMNGRVTSSGW